MENLLKVHFSYGKPFQSPVHVWKIISKYQFPSGRQLFKPVPVWSPILQPISSSNSWLLVSLLVKTSPRLVTHFKSQFPSDSKTESQFSLLYPNFPPKIFHHPYYFKCIEDHKFGCLMVIGALDFHTGITKRLLCFFIILVLYIYFIIFY